ncbi:MAG: hypothetical protein AVDCRST_MAG19-1078 [uncultured Thermomicrobiales bacterium]|uniref:Uncharacterized protein n=1 Tax=uncultured Thermomicrobiales bacterium TaxID=1645740 RepID=A0A6J4UNQ6_9BACT|nr:MAG: hypothetical protein AVDCRST_MAG19-1078 [uncultured Thermomicrobiales bacterium]
MDWIAGLPVPPFEGPAHDHDAPVNVTMRQGQEAGSGPKLGMERPASGKEPEVGD